MKNPLVLSLLVVALTFAGIGTGFGKKVKVTIRFIPVVSDGVTAACEANTSMKKIKADNADQIEWTIKKDEQNPCAFSCQDVRLQFPARGIVNDDNNNAPDEYVLCHGNKAEATVVPGPKKIYKYVVQLKKLLAEDPELEVSGTLPEDKKKK